VYGVRDGERRPQALRAPQVVRAVLVARTRGRFERRSEMALRMVRTRGEATSAVCVVESGCRRCWGRRCRVGDAPSGVRRGIRTVEHERATQAMPEIKNNLGARCGRGTGCGWY
jgi:hypothetical protein